MKKRFWYSIGVLLLIFSSCDKDDYEYPPIKLEFLTAVFGNAGSLKSIWTDDGKNLSVVEDRTRTKSNADTTFRALSNYELLANGKARVYGLTNVVSVAPLPEKALVFKSGIKTDPVSVQSIWLGKDYLNLVLSYKSQNKQHFFHFVEKEVGVDEKGRAFVRILLYHDNNGDAQGYTKRAYLSVPLKKYDSAQGGITYVRFEYWMYDSSGKKVLNNISYTDPGFPYVPDR